MQEKFVTRSTLLPIFSFNIRFGILKFPIYVNSTFLLIIFRVVTSMFLIPLRYNALLYTLQTLSTFIQTPWKVFWFNVPLLQLWLLDTQMILWSLIHSAANSFLPLWQILHEQSVQSYFHCIINETIESKKTEMSFGSTI